MFVSVIHKVRDPDAFWSIAAKAMESMPSDLKLPQYVTSPDRSLTICLWESPSVEKLKSYLEPLIGQVSANEYIAIDPANSAGLPTGAGATA